MRAILEATEVLVPLTVDLPGDPAAAGARAIRNLAALVEGRFGFLRGRVGAWLATASAGAETTLAEHLPRVALRLQQEEEEGPRDKAAGVLRRALGLNADLWGELAAYLAP